MFFFKIDIYLSKFFSGNKNKCMKKDAIVGFPIRKKNLSHKFGSLLKLADMSESCKQHCILDTIVLLDT